MLVGIVKETAMIVHFVSTGVYKTIPDTKKQANYLVDKHMYYAFMTNDVKQMFDWFRTCNV